LASSEKEARIHIARVICATKVTENEYRNKKDRDTMYEERNKEKEMSCCHGVL